MPFCRDSNPPDKTPLEWLNATIDEEQKHADELVPDDEQDLYVSMAEMAWYARWMKSDLYTKPDGTVRHHSIVQVLQHFTARNLEDTFKVHFGLFSDLAYTLVDTLPEGPELTIALRSLLGCRDAADRAPLTPPPDDPPPPPPPLGTE